MKTKQITPAWPEIFAQHFEGAVRETTSYFINNATRGWQYSYMVEHSFIDPDLQPFSKAEKKVEDTFAEKPLTQLSDKSAAELLHEIGLIKDHKERWAAVCELVTADHKALLVDDFAQTESDSPLNDRLAACMGGDKLNIVIIGAGCIGLALANIFKHALGDDIEVLLIENRVQTPHIKKPYTRNWLTNILLERLDVMDPVLKDIIKGFGQDLYMGVSINVLETLLLLSCRKIGVQCLFVDNYDLSFVEKSNVHLIFDTTGGRLGHVVGAVPSKEQEIMAGNTQQLKIAANKRDDYEDVLAGFGVNGIQNEAAPFIELRENQGLYYPYVDDRQIKMATIKLTNIPVSLYEELLEFVRPRNHDALFYLWPGRLQDDFNQILFFINLHKETYEALAGSIHDLTTLTDFLQGGGLELFESEPRVIELFEFLKTCDVRLDALFIEPPFLYIPYLYHIAAGFQRLFDRPIIPMGDSVYNGNKAGNGLGPHLLFLHNLHEYILTTYGQLRTDVASASDGM